MPYKMYKEGSKWCVKNEQTGESKGCSATRSMAVKHMGALYAHEGKKEAEIDQLITKALDDFKAEYPDEPEEDPLETKMYGGDMDEGEAFSYYPYYGATSFEELDQMEQAQEKSQDVSVLTNQYTNMLSNIVRSPMMDDKEKVTAAKDLAEEYHSRLTGVVINDQSLDDLEGKELEDEEKAKWSTAHKNDLPDSSFLYVESGCKTKDCRHFPYKNADGKVDVAHLRNAIARIPQSNAPGLSSEKKKALQARARKMLAEANKEIKEQSFIQKAINAVKDAFMPVRDDNFLVFKEDNGQYAWIARYSNNFRDDDNPPEIISEASHKRFVERIEKGIDPLPELWLWHIPEWKFGYATWVAYDDNGFAVAGGKIDKGKEAIAEWLSKQKNISVSHGMPPLSIKRDVNDPSIIVEHTTREISPLPDWAAANKLTGFIVLDESKSKEQITEGNMPIPENKRKALIEQWKIDPTLLDKLELANATDAQKANAAGVESKEKTEPVAQATTETPVTPVVPETAQDKTKDETQTATETPAVTDTPITREEIADAFASIVTPFVDTTTQALQALTARLDTLQEQVKELKGDEEQKIVKKAMQTPAASLVAMFNARSAIGSEKTQVDGRSQLGKSKPKEAANDETAKTGVPFLDSMLSGGK